MMRREHELVSVYFPDERLRLEQEVHNLLTRNRQYGTGPSPLQPMLLGESGIPQDAGPSGDGTSEVTNHEGGPLVGGEDTA